MKTPNLDREIETYEIHKKQGYLTKDGENYLAEFKAIKQALIIADVSQQHEPLQAFKSFCSDNYSLDIPDRIIYDYKQSL